jgi:argininosuccinate lyase
MKLWAGRFQKETDTLVNDFNSSISFDVRLYRQDIQGSIAHATMLGEQGVITREESLDIIQGLQAILQDIEDDKVEFSLENEDIHMNVEAMLTERIGPDGKRLHTGRSRNDQVAVDFRLYVKQEIPKILGMLLDFERVLIDKARENTRTVMPGYTHLQRAQPILLSHHLLAYVMMLLRDLDRLADCRKRMNVSPIGACALAGTSYDTDREMEARRLGFDGIALNSIDAVSDRDFCVELMGCLSLLMMHLSRLAEELVLWSSWEFRFITLSDAFTTGSSIMPQKKNPDMAELVRGKTGRVYGDLIGLLTTLKGLPLAYNKDMQEDKEAVFDACDTAKACLGICIPMLEGMTVQADNMLRAARTGFINATDLADYLVGKGLPFRTAYKISGELVAECIRRSCVLETLPLEVYRAHSELIGEDVYPAIELKACVEKRSSAGGTCRASVLSQIAYVKEKLSL